MKSFSRIYAILDMCVSEQLTADIIYHYAAAQNVEWLYCFKLCVSLRMKFGYINEL